ncbi:putative tetratricopeptide-like helical domain superfamily, DYW domain-containing protein [Dioscorea sansibarensis]
MASTLLLTPPSCPPPPLHLPSLQNPPSSSSSPPQRRPLPTPSSWTETLRSHARANSFHEALSTFISMTSTGVYPDHFAFPAALKAAAGLKDPDAGRQLHAAVVKSGYHSSPVTVSNTLLTMYAKCDDIGCAFKVFDRMPEKDQVSWSSMVAAFCMFEEWDLALEAFRMMQEDGLDPSSFTLVSVVQACSNLSKSEGLRLGKQVHGYGLRNGFYSDGKTFTYNSLVSMYAKLGKVCDSLVLFDRFDNRDTVTWNTMISSLAQNDRDEEALALVNQMVLFGIKPDGVTLSSVLPACSRLELFNVGKEIHAYALRNDGLSENSFVACALVDMYCNFGKVEGGRHLFDRVLEKRLGIWNAMISGYAQNGLYEEALDLFIQVETIAGLMPNATTLASVLPACVCSETFPDKESIHGYVVKRGLECDKYVQNTLMDMYSRVGKLDVARRIFNGMEARDVVSWNTMITGCIICGHFSEAFCLLSQMQRTRNTDDEVDTDAVVHTNYKPNNISLITVLPACAILAALAKGKEIHAYAVRNFSASDVAVGSALVDMYAKCGCLTLSRRVFDRMSKRNVITWNVLIMAYGMNGQGEEALRLFQDMVIGGEAKPNEVTYIAVFAACSHSGMVDKGVELFHKMRKDHEVEPTAEHYACVVDLLGRAGKLEKAYRLITMMQPGIQQAGAWSSLLGSCRIHHDVKLGETAANHLFELEPNVSSHYVLLSNIYAAAGLWDKAMEVRYKMKELGVKKEPGYSWIEVGDQVHQFRAGDSLHPQSAQVHAFLEKLWSKMRKEGYVPDTSCVLHNVDEDEKELLLCGHSEKLAIAFGILNTAPGTPIRVAKNLRVCNDCHTASKYISKIEGRDIILRDVRRFHHFRNGLCSCGDYW